MPNIVIVGAQWGDEGKGKVVDLLTRKVQVVARYNGGHNAGHTVIVGDKKYIVHVIPSGILHRGILCVAGNGMVINPAAFEQEKKELEDLGVEVGEDLVLSDRIHLILPHHYALEALSEEQRGKQALGTTLRGTGPAYEDKIGRRGIRAGDLRHPEALRKKLEYLVAEKNDWITAHGGREAVEVASSQRRVGFANNAHVALLGLIRTGD